MRPVGFDWKSNLLFGGLDSQSKNGEGPVGNSQLEPPNLAPASISSTVAGSTRPAQSSVSASQRLRTAIAGATVPASATATVKATTAGIGCSIAGSTRPCLGVATIRQSLRSSLAGTTQTRAGSGTFRQTLRALIAGSTLSSHGAATLRQTLRTMIAGNTTPSHASASVVAAATLPITATIEGTTNPSRSSASVKAAATQTSPPTGGYSGLVQWVFHKKEPRTPSWEKYLPKQKPAYVPPPPIGCSIQTRTAPCRSSARVFLRIGCSITGATQANSSRMATRMCLSSRINGIASPSISSLCISQSDPELEDFLALVLEGFL